MNEPHDQSSDPLSSDSEDKERIAMLSEAKSDETTQVLLTELADLQRERQQAELLRVTLASIGDAVIVTDPAGRISTLNKVAQSLTAWPKEDAIGQPLDIVFRIVNEYTRQPVENPATRALREGVIVGLANHTILIARDGTERPIDDSAAPIRSETGDVVGCVLVFRDVSERRRLELENANRQKHAQLLASIVTSSEDAIISKTLEGIIQTWNAGAERIFGYTPEQVIGHHISILIPPERADEEDRIISQIRAGQRVEHFETIRVSRDGRRIPISLTISPIKDEAGQVIGASKIARDISDQQHAAEALREKELRYRLVANAANDAIWDWNLITNEVLWNEGVGTRFGYTPEQVGVEASWWIEHIHPDDQDRIRLGIHEVIESGDELWQDEYRFRRSDGSYAHVFDRGRVVRSEEKIPIRMIGSMLDLTERLRAQEKLREQEAQYRSIFEATSDAVLIFGYDGHLIEANPAACSMHGYAYDELIRMHGTQFIHPEDHHKFGDFVQQVTRGEEFRVEGRHLRKDGETISVQVRGCSFVYAGRPALLAVVRDISEETRAAEALRQSEERFAFVRSTSGVGFWYCDLPFDVLQWDANVKEHFHLPPEAGVTIETFYERLHPEDRQSTREAIERSISDRTSYNVDYRTVDPATGAQKWVQAIGRTFYAEDGSPIRFDGITIDVTQRQLIGTLAQENEQRFRTLVEQVKDYAIFMTDTEGKPTTWNEGVLRVLGFEEEEFIRHDITPVIFTPEDIAQGVPQAELSTAANVGSASDDRWMRRKDGSRFWAAGVTTGLHDNHRRLLGFMKVMRDQTDRKQMEDELRNVAAELSEADRRKTEFLATLGHELRNPLAPIRTGLEAIKLSKPGDAMLAEVRNVMERQVQQMARLIDDLLDVSRITRDKLELRKCQVAISDVVQSAVEATRPYIDEAGHELTVKLPSRSIFVEADPNRLAQVFSNLLNNAAKYTPDGGQIALSVERQQDEVVVTVKDNGLGIPAEKLDDIFEMFTQINRPLEKGHSGLGIGLTLVKRLVELHNGRIEVRSDGLHKGSQFSVRLQTSVSPPATKGHRDEPSVKSTRFRILVVDDNKAAASMLTMVVKMLGNDVRTAHDGGQAIEIAAEFRPDVILMDLGMPKIDGYEAARHIRQQNWGKNILLIALTGWGQEEDRERTHRAGFNHHLVKPADPATIQKLLQDHHAHISDSN